MPPRGAIAAFLERHPDRASEAVWFAALGWIETATGHAREVFYGRWRYYPTAELRRLRTELAGALLLARFAVALQEEENEAVAELERELYREAERVASLARREQTREAERVRLLRARCRREGREPTREELEPWLHAKSMRKANENGREGA